MKKRLLALTLCTALTLGTAPLATFANEGGNQTVATFAAGIAFDDATKTITVTETVSADALNTFINGDGSTATKLVIAPSRAVDGNTVIFGKFMFPDFFMGPITIDKESSKIEIGKYTVDDGSVKTHAAQITALAVADPNASIVVAGGEQPSVLGALIVASNETEQVEVLNLSVTKETTITADFAKKELTVTPKDGTPTTVANGTNTLVVTADGTVTSAITLSGDTITVSSDVTSTQLEKFIEQNKDTAKKLVINNDVTVDIKDDSDAKFSFGPFHLTDQSFSGPITMDNTEGAKKITIGTDAAAGKVDSLGVTDPAAEVVAVGKAGEASTIGGLFVMGNGKQVQVNNISAEKQTTIKADVEKKTMTFTPDGKEGTVVDATKNRRVLR